MKQPLRERDEETLGELRAATDNFLKLALGELRAATDNFLKLARDHGCTETKLVQGWVIAVQERLRK